MPLQPGAPEAIRPTQIPQKAEHAPQAPHYLERVQPNYPAYKTLMESAIEPYKDWGSKMHDIELFARPDSRQRPVGEKNLQDGLNSLLGSSTIFSSEIQHTLQGATNEGSQAVSIGSFFRQIVKDGREGNLKHSLSWLAESSFEGYSLADTLARYVYGVKAEPASATVQEPQQQHIPQRLEKLLDTQIPIDVVKSAVQRLQKNPVGITLSMLLQEVAGSYPPFMENVAENLISTQPAEHQSAQLMLQAFQRFLATYPEPHLIKEPLWKQWYNRIKHNRLFGKPKQLGQPLTPQEMKRLLRGTKRIVRKSERFSKTLYGAPSQIGKLTVDTALKQVRERHPDGIISAITDAAKTNEELNNQPFEGKLPLSPEQEKYIARAKKEDRDSIRYYLEQDNYLLNLYQKYVGLF